MSIEIPEDKIRTIIGKWWETIQKIQADFDVKISIEDDWQTTVTAKTQEWGQKAIDQIKELLWIPTTWYKWKWTIMKIIDWIWAIVEFRSTSWMIHISKLAAQRVNNVEDIVKVWEEVEFEIIQVDLAKGRIWLKRDFKEEEVKVKKVEVKKK
jgi:polyribonucleotide nucleotidyltransferase